MKLLIVTAAIATAAMMSPASAKMMACTGENLGKSITATSVTPDSPKKMAVLKEMAAANTALSKGDARGACKNYMKAQKMAAAK